MACVWAWQVWNLVLLQNNDGSFEMTEALATALTAGTPHQEIKDQPVSTFGTSEIENSVPDRLRAMFPKNEYLLHKVLPWKF